MKAEIAPLNGKYYGTRVHITDGPARGASITIWLATGEPSKREIEFWGHTQDEWDSNAEVEDGWGGKAPIKNCDFICDSHYECRESFRVAEAIVEALKKLN